MLGIYLRRSLFKRLNPTLSLLKDNKGTVLIIGIGLDFKEGPWFLESFYY